MTGRGKRKLNTDIPQNKAPEKASKKIKTQPNQQPIDVVDPDISEFLLSTDGINSLTSNCQGNIVPENLPVYDLFSDIQESSESVMLVEQLNKCVNILQQQILDTSHYTPSGTSPLHQENVFCSVKKKKDPKTKQMTVTVDKYTGTVRAQGLFKTSEINRYITNNIKIGDLSILNKLCNGYDKYKFAIQASEGNPNGVLAISLLQALKYQSLGKQLAKDTITTILDIYNASRGDVANQFANDTLNTFLSNIQMKAITNQQIIEEKLAWITRVYGPYLNKGLSDISQAGELAKLYILKYVKDKRNSEISIMNTNSQVSNKMNFWETTSGRPVLVAFSSDAIASALGVRIQNSFKGQFQSILPRKHGRGRFSVIYIPYKYFWMMKYLSDEKEPPITSNLERQIWDIKLKFATSVQTAFETNNIQLSIYPFTDDFLNNVRILVDNIFSYYKELSQQNEFFSKNIIEIIDNITINLKSNNDLKNNDLKNNDLNKLRSITNNFYNTYTQLFTADFTNSEIDKNKKAIINSLLIFKNILLVFGNMIEELNKFVINNESILLSNISQVSNLIQLPSWTGILYSTISYYENCNYFNNMSDNELLELYLNISSIEESCAEQDVDYGHDQSASSVQSLGIEVAENWFGKKNEFSNIRPTKEKDRHIDETEFSKNLIDKMKYFSVSQSYDSVTKNPILIANFTKDPSTDFMFNLNFSVPQASTIVNNIRTIGNCETWGSIDYTVGDPFINITKSIISNEFASYHEFKDYFDKENIIEIRTPTTNFDAAAPSGCLFRNVEKMCVSYRKFTPTIGSGKVDKTIDNSYIFVMLTIDLNQNSKNTLNFDKLQCQQKYTPFNIFTSEFTRADEIIEMMREFSKPFEISDGKRDKLKSNSIQSLVSDCYNNNSQFKTFITSNSENNILQQKIISILNNVAQLIQSLKNKRTTKMTDTKFKDLVVPLFDEMVSDIGNYYLECVKNNCSVDNKNFVKDLLVKMYKCMFKDNDDLQIKVDKTVEKINTDNTPTTNIASRELAAAAASLVNLTNDQGLAKGLHDDNFNINSQDINEYLNQEDKITTIEENDVNRLLQLYQIDTEEQARSLYDEAKNFWINKNKAINSPDLSETARIKALESYIKHRPIIKKGTNTIEMKKIGGLRRFLSKIKNPKKTRRPNKHRLSKKKHRNIRGRKTHKPRRVNKRYTRHKK